MLRLNQIKRLEHKYKKSTLGKKKSKGDQNLLDILIPLGMIFGCAIGVIFSMFFPITLLSTVSLGAGIGLLLDTLLMKFIARRGKVIH